VNEILKKWAIVKKDGSCCEKAERLAGEESIIPHSSLSLFHQHFPHFIV
jgi:hypothetical protein